MFPSRYKLAALLLLIGLSLGLAGSPPDLQISRVSLPQYTRTQLNNGLTLVLYENHELPVVAANLMVRAGGSYEPAEKAGLANFTAQMLLKGTRARTSTEIFRQVDALGGVLGATASWDYINITAQGQSFHLDELIRILADVVQNPRFDPADISKYRRTALSLIQRFWEDPEDNANAVLFRGIYGDHRYGRFLIGDRASVNSFVRKDIVDFYQRYFVPENSVLGLAGDFEMSRARTIIEREFGTWRRGLSLSREAFSPPAEGSRRIVLVDRPELSQVFVRIGWLAVARKDSDFLPLSIMSQILGGGQELSRLWELREKKGYTYDINSFFESRLLPAAFTISTFTKTRFLKETLEFIFAEIKKIRSAKVAPEELAHAKASYLNSLPFRIETPLGTLAQILISEAYNLPLDYFDSLHDQVLRIEGEEVNRVARKYLDPEKAMICIVGPAAEIRKDLERFGTVEVIKGMPASKDRGPFFMEGLGVN